MHQSTSTIAACKITRQSGAPTAACKEETRERVSGACACLLACSNGVRDVHVERLQAVRELRLRYQALQREERKALRDPRGLHLRAPLVPPSPQQINFPQGIIPRQGSPQRRSLHSCASHVAEDCRTPDPGQAEDCRTPEHGQHTRAATLAQRAREPRVAPTRTLGASVARVLLPRTAVASRANTFRTSTGG
jgi:hypothetical protein